jgi:hypothetical protein
MRRAPDGGNVAGGGGSSARSSSSSSAAQPLGDVLCPISPLPSTASPAPPRWTPRREGPLDRAFLRSGEAGWASAGWRRAARWLCLLGALDVHGVGRPVAGVDDQGPAGPRRCLAGLSGVGVLVAGRVVGQAAGPGRDGLLDRIGRRGGAARAGGAGRVAGLEDAQPWAAGEAELDRDRAAGLDCIDRGRAAAVLREAGLLVSGSLRWQ